MRRTRLMLTMLGLALFTTAFAAVPKDVTPEDLAQGFYAHYMRAKTMGVPNAKDRSKLHGMITPALEDAFAKADAAEKQYAVDTKNEVPPLVEGDLFTSLFEGATSYSVRSCTVTGTTAQCVTDLTNNDNAGAAPTKWQDTLVLTQVPQSGWRIDNIIYGGTWEFAKKDQLIKVLKDVVWEAKSISQ